MFGFSFGEILVVALVAMVVVGPRQLPAMMRTLGQWVGKMRRMAFDMRSQSGIDEILRLEGLEKDIRQLQSLVRGNVLDALAVDMDSEIKAGDASGLQHPSSSIAANADLIAGAGHEYPVAGCDCYGAVAEDVDPYTMAFDASSPIDASSELPAESHADNSLDTSSKSEDSQLDMHTSEKRSDG